MLIRWRRWKIKNLFHVGPNANVSWYHNYHRSDSNNHPRFCFSSQRVLGERWSWKWKLLKLNFWWMKDCRDCRRRVVCCFAVLEIIEITVKRVSYATLSKAPRTTWLMSRRSFLPTASSSYQFAGLSSAQHNIRRSIFGSFQTVSMSFISCRFHFSPSSSPRRTFREEEKIYIQHRKFDSSFGKREATMNSHCDARGRQQAARTARTWAHEVLIWYIDDDNITDQTPTTLT